MLGNGLIDGIIPEPLGGAHANIEKTYETFKTYIETALNELMGIESEKLIETRIAKFSKMGAYTED